MRKPENQSSILLESGTNEVEFLIVKLGEQKYGINVSKVCQIMVFDPRVLSQIPNQGPEMLGVMTFRNQTISVVDLSINLQRRGDHQPAQRLLIMAEFNNRRTGFVVDSVDKIERVSWQEFEPITETTCNGITTSVVGTVRSDGLVIILDLESIIASLDPSMSIEFHAKDIGVPSLDRTAVRVLHCEDSIVIQKLVYQVLTNAGFTRVEQVNNGQGILDYVQKNGRGAVDIILSDIEMPSMDGLTMCRKLREDPRFESLPVIFFSSLINEQMVAKCRSVGGSAAYSKPQINMIVGAIEELVQKERG
jgi:two-component system chemotaxis response regulator CheV